MENKIIGWLNKGLIDEAAAKALIEDSKLEAQKTAKIRIQIALYSIGALLISLAIILFIAANNWIWEILNQSKLLKIFILFVLSSSFLYTGCQLVYQKEKYQRLGRALIFLSSLSIGGTYALIGQVYNFNAHNSSIMFLWAVGILPLAYLFKEKAVNIVSLIVFILGVIFFYMELSYDEGYVWTVFLPIMLGAFLYNMGNIPYIQENYNEFSLTYKLTGLASIFITLLILTFSVESSYQMTSLYYLVPIYVSIALCVINFFITKEKTKLFIVECGYLLLILALLILLLFSQNIAPIALMCVSHLLIIAMIIFGYKFGYEFDNNAIVNLSTKMLIIYILAIYFRFGWGYFDKVLFFLIGGVILFSIGNLLEQKNKGLQKGDKK